MDSQVFHDECESQPITYESNGKEPYTDYVVSMGLDAPDVKPKRLGEQTLVHLSKPARDSKKVEWIRLQSGCAPPRALTVNIVQLHREVTNVNDRILSGLVVSEQEWIALRKQVIETQHLMRNMNYE